MYKPILNTIMITFKKSELEQVLLNISTFSVGTPENPKQEMIFGLLKENLPLSVKRKLQKIHKKTHEAYKELAEDAKSLKEECGEDVEKFNKEVVELFSEDVNIDAEKVSLAIIEEISTTDNYNFEIIEKFAE